ncbi:MAG: MarR family transcriptional regulator [Myxococcales bacterium]|nr:MarR family transcriptional regulator [Myxococcales bacterium]
MAEKLLAALRESPLFLTTRAALMLSVRARKALRARGIVDVSPAQLSVLAALEDQDGVTVSALARTLELEKSTLSPLLDKLEAHDLLARARDPKDGRLQRLYLTRAGRRRRREVEAVMEQVTREVLASLPKKVVKHHVAFCEAVLSARGDAREDAA